MKEAERDTVHGCGNICIYSVHEGAANEPQIQFKQMPRRKSSLALLMLINSLRAARWMHAGSTNPANLFIQFSTLAFVNMSSVRLLQYSSPF